MKKLRYADDINGWGTIITLTREQAIQRQRNSYQRVMEIQLTEEQLLEDFIAINEACWVDDEEAQI